jgi:hypothetical protein
MPLLKLLLFLGTAVGAFFMAAKFPHLSTLSQFYIKYYYYR